MMDSPHDCKIMIGTSGYSYAEWRDAGFYPPGTPASRMLAEYNRSFKITELNYTWYQMPKAPSIERMRQTAGPGFMFAAKLTRTMTHEIDPKAWPDQADRFCEGIAPLVRSGQLASVLIQLPPYFERSRKNRLYLAALTDKLAALLLAVEFRHISWAVDSVFKTLARRRIALAAVDEPGLPGLFPVTDVVTCPDFFYIRFHGRNDAGWRSNNIQNKFDYDYSEAELKQWAEERIIPMASRAGAGYIFFNNHVRAQAPKNAQTLKRLLAESGLKVV